MLFHTINRVSSWKCEGFRIKCLTVRISPNLTPKSSKPGAIPSTCHSEVKFLSFMWEKSVFMLPVERYSTDTNKSFRCTFCVNILFVLKSLHWPVGVKWWLQFLRWGSERTTLFYSQVSLSYRAELFLPFSSKWPGMVHEELEEDPNTDQFPVGSRFLFLISET